MKSVLDPMRLNTLCSWEKCSPPTFQLIRTAPLNSASSKRCTNTFVNSYNNNKNTQHIIQHGWLSFRGNDTIKLGHFVLRFISHKFADNQGTLMLSTSDPGGGSCRAMVSDVSMVKYTSMGHSFLSGGNKHTKITHETFMENGNAFKSAIVPCYITTSVLTYEHDMLLWMWRTQFHGTHSCTPLAGCESGLQKEDRARRPLTPASSSSPVWAQDNLFISYFISQNQWSGHRTHGRHKGHKIQQKHWIWKDICDNFKA